MVRKYSYYERIKKFWFLVVMWWLMFQISLFKPGDGCCVLDPKQRKFETPNHILATAIKLSEISHKDY